MMELEINGTVRRIEPASAAELEAEIRRALGANEIIYALSVDGSAVAPDRLSDLALQRIRSVCVRAAPPAVVARTSAHETREWIGRICSVLESIAEDWRAGRERAGRERLPAAMDALVVLTEHLGALRPHLLRGAPEEVTACWTRAEGAFSRAVTSLDVQLRGADPIAVADGLGYALPRALREVAAALERVVP